MNKEQFISLLPKVLGKDTSVDPENWNDKNYLWGQCVIASLLAQDEFGEELLRFGLLDTIYASSISHYRNRFSDGIITDFTGAQFLQGIPDLGEGIVREREYLLANDFTKTRYLIARERLNRLINN